MPSETIKIPDPLEAAVRLEGPPVFVRLASAEAEVEARIVLVAPRALVVMLTKKVASPNGRLNGPFSGEIAAHGGWRWSRLTPLAHDDHGLTLTSDDAYDRAALWSFFFETQRATGVIRPEAADEAAGEIPFRGHYARDKSERRMAWLRERTAHDLTALTAPRLVPEQLQGNIEQFVGSVEIPVGLVGPLLVHGQAARGHFVAPFATTEGALVASASRGAKALTLSGGVATHVAHQRMTRAPVFVMKSSDGAARLAQWLGDHEQEIRVKAEAASNHAKLVRVEPIQIGRYLHVRFIYETGDAAGQNMTTICTSRACGWIRSELQFAHGLEIEFFFIEGNTSGDKKASFLGTQDRGIRVTAEALVPRSVLKRVLNVTPTLLLEAFTAGTTGSMYSGMAGMNVNVANVVAAIFTATGQDIACVHESSAAQFHLKAHADGVLATLLINGLVIGTVGGGTWLPTQSDALRVLGCVGEGRVQRLAEIIGAFALALELSTMSAVAAGEFVAAHEMFGRRRSEVALHDGDLTPSFFEARLRAAAPPGEDSITVEEAIPLEQAEGDSVLGQLIAGRTRKKLGVFPYAVTVRTGEKLEQFKLALKVKPSDAEVVRAISNIARLGGEQLAILCETHAWDLGFRNCHVRELRLAEMVDPRVRAVSPHTYFTFEKHPTPDDPRGIYLLATEYLEGMTHMGTANDPRAWREDDIQVVLDGLASFHAAHLDDVASLRRAPWMEEMTPRRMQRLSPLWAALVERNHGELPEVFTPTRTRRMLHWLADVRTRFEELASSPLTLVHNDFCPRNLALRPVPSGGARLCAFDWELATIGAPQRDLCEFLAWVLPPSAPPETHARHREYFRLRLEHHSGRALPKDEFIEVYRIACMDFAVTRISMYTVTSGFRSLEWLRRVLDSHFTAFDAM